MQEHTGDDDDKDVERAAKPASELLMLIQTMAMRHELFVSPSSVLYFVVKLGACSTNSRVALPTPMGMMMEMISFGGASAVSAMSVSVPPSPSGR